MACAVSSSISSATRRGQAALSRQFCKLTIFTKFPKKCGLVDLVENLLSLISVSYHWRKSLIITEPKFAMAAVLNIYHAADNCQALFKSCLLRIEGRKPLPFFRSAQGDFNLWCSATRATASGISSLDHRLSNHGDTKQTIIDLLQELILLLEKCEQLFDRECELLPRP